MKESNYMQRLAMLVFVIVASISIHAQQQSAQVAPMDQPGHIFTLTMLKIEPARMSEFLDFWEKEFVPLEKNIPEILSSKVLQHRWGPSDYMVFVLHEYKDLASVDRAQKQQEGAIQRRAMSDPKAAEAFKKFQTFTPGHVDYILFSADRVRKFGTQE
jgi:hypothetical protein